MSIVGQYQRFGGKTLIEAADPLQNAPFDTSRKKNGSNTQHLLPFYTGDLFKQQFSVAIHLMDGDTNHRFCNPVAIGLLNKIRRNNVSLQDVNQFHSLVNIVENVDNISGDDATRTLKTLMDLVNTLIVRDDYEAEYADATRTYSGKPKLRYMADNQFWVGNRLEPYYAILDNLKGETATHHLNIKDPNWRIPRKTSNEEIFAYYKLSDLNIEHITQFKILCTENKQAEYYDLVYAAATQDPANNVLAEDTVTVEFPNGDKRAITIEQLNHADPESYKTLMQLAERKLKAKVNIRCCPDPDYHNPTFRRVINQAGAGPFLVSGMSVDLLSFSNGSILVKPIDVTGQDLVYPPCSIQRVTEEVEYRSFSLGVKYILTRRQFPICNGFATVVNKVAGLTYKDTKLVLDNTRTITDGAFYIFCGRPVDIKYLYLRFGLHCQSKGRDDFEKINVFEIKANQNALSFDNRARELYKTHKHSSSLLIPAKQFEPSTY